ncbi:MAG TPA: GNAT family N-acetyltransferase [Thermoanaerobaculia bacterium]|nr:GNAT family N-acetyltransferase [Thermoanaerobaculia bacterium]
MNISIRKGTPGDAEALADIARRTFHETFAAYNRPGDNELHEARTYGVAQQSRELQDPSIITLLAECDGALAGFTQLKPGSVPPPVPDAEHPIEVARFYVDKPWHGHGVAQKMMTAVEDEARRVEARTMWLGVWEHNERAKAFYAKCGFVDVGTQIFIVGTDPQTDRVMLRSL